MARGLSRLQACLLGLVLLSAAALGAYALVAIGLRSRFGSDALHLSTGMQAARGVEVGTRVRVQGVEAGEVEAIELPADAGGPVIIRMRLHGRFRPLVRNDATVQVVSEGMIGGKAIEILPGSPASPEAGENARLESRASIELSDLLVQVKETLDGIQEGQGSFGKLVKDPEAYASLLALLHQSRETMASFQEDADAVKRLPIIRSYVEDTTSLLVRPALLQQKQQLSEQELFLPGEARLSAKGKQTLDLVAIWISRFQRKNTEIVVVTYTDPHYPNPAAARILTKARSEVVCDYLRKQHAIQKLGWFSSRKLTPIGMGAATAPIPDKEPVAPDRTEIIVFEPRA